MEPFNVNIAVLNGIYPCLPLAYTLSRIFVEASSFKRNRAMPPPMSRLCCGVRVRVFPSGARQATEEQDPLLVPGCTATVSVIALEHAGRRVEGKHVGEEAVLVLVVKLLLLRRVDLPPGLVLHRLLPHRLLGLPTATGHRRSGGGAVFAAHSRRS